MPGITGIDVHYKAPVGSGPGSVFVELKQCAADPLKSAQISVSGGIIAAGPLRKASPTLLELPVARSSPKHATITVTAVDCSSLPGKATTSFEMP